MKTIGKLSLLPLSIDLESKAVLKQLSIANRYLAELKGVAHTIPNEEILLQTLTLQEARQSSDIENIVTTQDELYQASLETKDEYMSPATKEVLRYGVAMRRGFAAVRENKLLTNNIICEIQRELEQNQGGFRKVPGTVLKNNSGETVYEPPQDYTKVEELMSNLERYINLPELHDVDPLIKLAVIHYQFESIHPFYDGNGRTGRIICVLYLVINDLLDLPILYLSRYITRHKPTYYRLLQEVRTSAQPEKAWEEWILYFLKAIEETALYTISLVKGIRDQMTDYKKQLRDILGKAYSHDLLNCLFYSPYTKSEHLEKTLDISRPTAAKYLSAIADAGLLKKERIWRSIYYINTSLVALLADNEAPLPEGCDIVESVSPLMTDESLM